jgi:hypothetical protein
MTSSSSTKDISRSSWVNSGWRKPRRSSSRKQRAPGARLQARGHQEVAGALGRGAREDRRLDLQEVALVEHVAHRLDDEVAQLHRAQHRLAAQIDRAVLQAQHLVDLDVLVDGERRGLGLGQHVHRRDGQLDVAGRDVGVLVLRITLDEPSRDGDDVLGAQALGGGEG